MKKIILILVAIATIILPYNPAIATFAYTLKQFHNADTVGGGFGTNNGSGNGLYMQSFTANSSYVLNAISVNAGANVTPNLRFYINSGIIKGSGNLTYTGLTSSNDSKGLPLFVLNTPIAVTNGTVYAISCNNPLSWAGTVGNNYTSGGAYYDNSGWTNSGWTAYDLSFNLYSSTPAPIVGTLGYEKSGTNGLKLKGVISSLGAENSVSTGFQWGTTTSYENGNVTAQTIAVGSSTFFFNKTVTGVLTDVTYHFRAYAIGNLTGITYGPDVTTVNTFAAIETLTATNITFNQATLGALVSNTGAGGAWTVGFQYATNSSGDYAYNVPAANITGPSYVYSTFGSLSTGTTYHYRAYMYPLMSPSDVIYGADKVFYTHNPNQPSWIDSITMWFGMHGLGSTFWWVVLIVLMGLVWIPFHKWPVIAIVFDFVLIGASMALSTIDVWIIILLAIVAAGLIIGVVYKGMRDT